MMSIHPHTLARWERTERIVDPGEKAGYDSAVHGQVMILEQQGVDKTLERNRKQ